MLDLMTAELRMSKRLSNIGIARGSVNQLLMRYSAAKEARMVSIPRDVFDVRDHSESKTAILWWNDIEKDAKYMYWEKDLRMVREYLCFLSVGTVQINNYIDTSWEYDQSEETLLMFNSA